MCKLSVELYKNKARFYGHNILDWCISDDINLFEEGGGGDNNIYIIAIKMGELELYKLGYSDNIKRRINQYYSHNPFTVYKKGYNLFNGKELEKLIHKKFKSTIMDEWYNYDTISKIMDFLDVYAMKDNDGYYIYHDNEYLDHEKISENWEVVLDEFIQK